MNNFDPSYMCDSHLCDNFEDGYCHINKQYLKVRNNYYMRTSHCLISAKYELLDYKNELEDFPVFNNKIFLLVLNKKN